MESSLLFPYFKKFPSSTPGKNGSRLHRPDSEESLYPNAASGDYWRRQGLGSVKSYLSSGYHLPKKSAFLVHLSAGKASAARVGG